jgi:Domain of unknown function (DUF4159)
MNFIKALWGVFGVLALAGLLYAQRPFKEYPSVEHGEPGLPRGWNEKTEFAFARLMFPPGWNDGYRGRFDGPWQLGLSLWTQDYPKADRQFSNALARLTRIQVRPVEEAVNPDDDGEIFNWPFLYAVQVGEWGITPAQGKKLRDFLLRGGFFMADDFHGTLELSVFEKSMKLVFPDRPIVEIPDADPIFHTVFDLTHRYQIVGAEHLAVGYKNNGKVPHWLGIYDDKGRVMVAASYNSDIGDSWEWQDNPAYPVKYSDEGIRIGVNYVVYAMTH